METRRGIKEKDRPTAEGTRRRSQEAIQHRQALYRSQNIHARRHTTILADQKASGHEVRIEDGVVRYGSIDQWRREGIVSAISASMIAARAGTDASIEINGQGYGIARGHLLAKCLGGDGRDARNLVPLAHEFTNLQQYQQIEKNVLYHVLRHKTQVQRQMLGRVTLKAAGDAVVDPIHRSLHTRGYYHVVRYHVTPRYSGNERVFPASLAFVARCTTCGEWVQDALTIANTV